MTTNPVRTMRGACSAAPGTVIVVHEEELSAVLSEFARTVITDFSIQAILDHLVERITDVLPVTAVGVTVMSETDAPHYMAASNPAARRFVELQAVLGEGPCRVAFDSGEAVCVPDLAADDRFPAFRAAAVAAGLVSAFTFPLRHGRSRLGALDLYSEVALDLDGRDLAAAQTLADVTAAYLLNARARETALATAQRFQHSAMHDPLTGLPNRMLLQERLDHAAQRAQRSHTHCAVLFADLDRFKRVNDSHGHQVGDELLLGVARRLATLVRPGDTLARVSGDEFVFLCEDLRSPEDIGILAKRIDEALATPFVVRDIELSVRASVGMAYAGPGEEISGDLVAAADLAMYEAKRRRRQGDVGAIYDLRSAVRCDDDDSLERDLRAALAARRLEVHYQPIVRSSDGTVTAVEALLRWTDPQRGAVPPPAMIAAAEASGLIHELGAWVLERSCHDRHAWQRQQSESSLDLWVNVSGHQLARPGFAAIVASVLDRTGTDPRALVIEVTESAFMTDRDGAVSTLTELADRGIRLALDDFGSGFSSLSQLHRLPIHVVKVDQEFIASVDQAASGRMIIALVADMAHVLDLSVVAEGVENERQHDAVRAVGCDLAQGYFYARPVPASSIATMIASRSAETVHLPAPVPSSG